LMLLFASWADAVHATLHSNRHSVANAGAP
jgi:hypothetical protein